VLRLGAYQIRHLDRVPAHAVVNESVEAVRALGAGRAAGFINAVLRTLLRRGESLMTDRPPGPHASELRQIAYLTTSLSHPDWLVRRWLRRYGYAAVEKWCHFNNTSPQVTVRSTELLSSDDLRARLSADGIDAIPARFAQNAVQLPPGSLGRVSLGLRETLIVQDEGSQLVARFCAVEPGERVLDVCAAPGGKTLLLATDLGVKEAESQSLLVAADLRSNRLALLSQTMRRAQLPIPIVALDARRPLPFGAVFDCVLLDAPCSGLGTLRRDPDLKWTRREADLPRLAADQRKMLAACADAIRPGGRLVYATCSSEPEENEVVVEGFLAEDGRFALAPADPHVVAPDVLDGKGRLCTLPFRHELDAFFAAVLVRRHAT
jgi:16S rRNA (cytosine967-C5)-methyltransferase